MKAPKQSHLEYLLTTIGSEPDSGVAIMAEKFRTIRGSIEDGSEAIEQARAKMLEYREQAIACASNKHRTKILFDATIEYVINPDHTINAGVV